MADKTWKNLVYNVDISTDQVKKFYQHWYETYDEDMKQLKAEGPGADYVVDCLVYALSNGGIMRKHAHSEKELISTVTLLDVACGTGIVGEALARRGFSSVTGLDFSREMLDIANKKGVYNELVEAAFGTEVPECLEGRVFDSVVMKGGFAAGHLPLASLATMAKLCRPGGVVINSMTKAYTEIVPEYQNIDAYLARLELEGVWLVEERREVANYMAGKTGLIHVLRVK